MRSSFIEKDFYVIEDVDTGDISDFISPLVYPFVLQAAKEWLGKALSLQLLRRLMPGPSLCDQQNRYKQLKP